MISRCPRGRRLGLVLRGAGRRARQDRRDHHGRSESGRRGRHRLEIIREKLDDLTNELAGDEDEVSSQAKRRNAPPDSNEAINDLLTRRCRCNEGTEAMRTVRESGGNAFPTNGDDVEGMTLRDYFAAQVLTGFMAADVERMHLDVHEVSNYARQIYRVADAMLKAREE